MRPGCRPNSASRLEEWHGEPELVVELVNTSPADGGPLKDTDLYEASLEVDGLPTRPFILESLPDSFRYDRKIPAYGINVRRRACPGVRTLSVRPTPSW